MATTIKAFDDTRKINNGKSDLLKATKAINKEKAIKAVSEVIDSYYAERDLRRSLEIEVLALRKRVKELETKEASPSGSAQTAYATLERCRKDLVSLTGLDLNKRESLNQYLSRLKGFGKVDEMTRMGLLNSDQLFSLFHEFWTDPTTGKLVTKEKFQNILKRAFHIPNSSHRTPLLSADAVRSNLAVVCRVKCSKKPNPKDSKGNILEKDNPAYLSSKEPCVRFQARYTSKAVDLLRVNWHTYCQQ